MFKRILELPMDSGQDRLKHPDRQTQQNMIRCHL